MSILPRRSPPSTLLPYLILTILLISSLLPLTTATTTPNFTQPILTPLPSTLLTPGTTTPITWIPQNPPFHRLTLELWDQSSLSHLFAANTSGTNNPPFSSTCHPWSASCALLGTGIPNTGSFNWSIPIPAEGGDGDWRKAGSNSFWVKMYVEDFWRPEVGCESPVVSYSAEFGFGDAAAGGNPGGSPSGGGGGDSRPSPVNMSFGASLGAGASTSAPATAGTVTVGKATGVGVQATGGATKVTGVGTAPKATSKAGRGSRMGAMWWVGLLACMVGVWL